MLNQLISNIHKITRDGKESYFGKRWGAEAGLKKTVSRQDYTFDDVSKASPAKQLREQILTAYQSTPSAESKLFVEKLTNDSLSFLAKRRGLQLQQMKAEAICNESMTALVSRVFDRIEQYSVELNAYLGCTDLQTSLTRPAHVREVTRYSKNRQPLETVTYFRARLASPTWSLIIRGKDATVEVFLLPVGKSLGLTKSEADYEPIFVLTATLIKSIQEVEWELEDRGLTPMREQALSMEMFVRLIEATRNELELDTIYDSNIEY